MVCTSFIMPLEQIGVLRWFCGVGGEVYFNWDYCVKIVSHHWQLRLFLTPRCEHAIVDGIMSG